MSTRLTARSIRRLVLVGALVVVALPGNGRGWFGIESASQPRAALEWGYLERAALGPELARGIPTMRPIATPTSWPAPVVSPTPSATAPPVIALEPVIAAEEPAPTPPVAAPEPPPAPRPVPPPAVVAQLPASGIAVYAHAGDSRPVSALRGTTEFGTPRVLLTTLASTTPIDPWIEVYLPTRPNGATGWVPSSSVTLTTVADRITVDLAARTVTWERGADVVGVVSAAVGADRTPTPPGTYFVTDVLPYTEVGQASAAGEYGAWVVALNGHSDAFTTFDGGDARIAIHGTNAPASIGNAASSGCVRLAAEPLDTLARNVPLGTPVVIH